MARFVRRACTTQGFSHQMPVPMALLLSLTLVICAVLAWLLWAARQRAQRAIRAHQEALAKLEETNVMLTRIRRAVESATDAVGISDLDGRSVYHNRAHRELFGYSIDELNSRPGAGALFAHEAVAAEIQASVRRGTSWRGEVDVRTKDGRVIPAFVRADVVRDEQNRAIGIFGIFTDITERRRTERLVEEERQRLELTLRSIGEAVITIDGEGRIMLMNPAAEVLTGGTRSVFVGKRIEQLLDVRDEKTRTPMPLSIRDWQQQPHAALFIDEYLLIAPDGTERLIAQNGSLIRNLAGEVVGAVLALRDITVEREQAAQVARAKRLESLGLLAGSIAHDFGNLITTLAGHIEMAQRAPGLPESATKRLIDAERIVWRAHDVTQQLLTFARGETPRKKVLSLASVARDAVEMAAAHSAVQSIISIDPDLWTVEADEAQLVQVINNIALNAVQAMPNGGTLRLTAQNHTPKEGSSAPWQHDRWIKLSLSDTGPGIPSEHLERIFDPFFTTKPNGTGLGLARAYSIVNKHRGQLRVESTLGQGTTFHLLLPAADGRN